jgi:hypothetical protein
LENIIGAVEFPYNTVVPFDPVSVTEKFALVVAITTVITPLLPHDDPSEVAVKTTGLAENEAMEKQVTKNETNNALSKLGEVNFDFMILVF